MVTSGTDTGTGTATRAAWSVRRVNCREAPCR
ncbi:hypothetical protein K378_00923 [Streptomyces sp. Amel2xB2]|nr:hypothetical protein K378_00923 [Streptomyces sp. Amel2xB2]